MTTSAQDESPLDGVVDATKLYRYATLCRILHWGGRAQRAAIAKGLQTISFARQRYVTGAEVLRFFAALGNQRDESGRGP